MWQIDVYVKSPWWLSPIIQYIGYNSTDKIWNEVFGNEILHNTLQSKFGFSFPVTKISCAVGCHCFVSAYLESSFRSAPW